MPGLPCGPAQTVRRDGRDIHEQPGEQDRPLGGGRWRIVADYDTDDGGAITPQMFAGAETAPSVRSR